MSRAVGEATSVGGVRSQRPRVVFHCVVLSHNQAGVGGSRRMIEWAPCRAKADIVVRGFVSCAPQANHRPDLSWMCHAPPRSSAVLPSAGWLCNRHVTHKRHAPRVRAGVVAATAVAVRLGSSGVGEWVEWLRRAALSPLASPPSVPVSAPSLSRGSCVFFVLSLQPSAAAYVVALPAVMPAAMLVLMLVPQRLVDLVCWLLVGCLSTSGCAALRCSVGCCTAGACWCAAALHSCAVFVCCLLSIPPSSAHGYAAYFAF